MNISFVVVFLFLSVVNFINFSSDCETAPYKGLKAISVNKTDSNITNKEYLENLNKALKEINADLLYKTTDFNSDKTSYLLYKTNNTKDFLSGLNLENNGVLSSSSQCYSTLSSVRGMDKIMPVGLSSAFCDITIMDISLIEQYKLDICTFYTKQENIYLVIDAIEKLGATAEIVEDNSSSLIAELSQPLFLLCLLLGISIILYALSIKRKYALMKLNGYSSLDIILHQLKESLPFFALAFLIIQLLNFGLVGLMYKNAIIPYFKYCIQYILLAVVLVLALFFILISIIAMTTKGYMEIKGKSSKKAVFAIMAVTKVVVMFMLVFSLTISYYNLELSYKMFTQANNLEQILKNRVVTSVKTTQDDLFSNEKMEEYNKKAEEFYNLTQNKYNGVYIDSMYYQIAPDGVSTFADFSGSHFITINENYLSINPIHKPNGDEITSSDFAKDKLNILVSQVRNYTVNDIIEIYKPYLEYYTQDNFEEYVNVIVYKEDEIINSFNANTGQFTLGQLDNPDIIIYDFKYMPNGIFAGFTNNYYMIEVATDEPYKELLPLLEEVGLDSVITETPYVSNTFSDAVSMRIMIFVYEMVYTIIYIIALAVISIFMAKIYIENNREKIAVQKLFGMSFYSIYEKYIMLFAGTTLAISVALIFGQSIMGITPQIGCFIGVVIFDLLVFILSERRLSREIVLNTLKGE